MRSSSFILIASLVMSSLSVGMPASAGEEHEKIVKLEDIPAPARETILKEAKGATVIDVEVEQKKGQTLYEAHVRQGKDVIGIVVDAKGKLIGKHSEKDERE